MLRPHRDLGGVSGAVWRLCTVWFVSGGDGVAQARLGERERILPWTGGGHGDLDPPHAHPHQRAQLQQFQPDGAAGRLGKLRVRQPDAAQPAQQQNRRAQLPRAYPV
jgi:hypothetical protein